MDTNLQATDVEKYLDENPQFAESYFVRKATEEMVVRWNERRFFVGSSEANGRAGERRNASLGRISRSKLRSSIIEDEEMSFDEDDHIYDVCRRHSEPHRMMLLGSADERVRRCSDSRSVPSGLPSIALDNNWKRSILEQSRQRALSLETTVQGDLTEKRQQLTALHQNAFLSKHALRKSQSFPICRNTLANLINSSVIPPESASLDWKEMQHLKAIDHTVFLHELMCDIAQDLNLNSLTRKLVSNIGLVADCSRVSIVYIKDGRAISSSTANHDNTNNLDARLSVYQSTDCDGQLPTEHSFDMATITHVMETRQSYLQMRPMENKDDANTTETVIYKPIKSPTSEIVGIVCLAYSDDEHSQQLESENQILDLYLSFCGIVITNVRLFTLSANEFNRNKSLLELARDMFEHQTSLEKMIQKMSTKALELLKANQCSILLLKQSKSTTSNSSFERRRKGLDFGKVFTHGTTAKSRANFRKQWYLDDSMEMSKDEDVFTDNVASYVAETGLTYNSAQRVIIEKEEANRQGHSTSTDSSGTPTTAVLCMPIRNNAQEVIGVVKLEGRSPEDDHFDEVDEKILEAFTIFCGLGINNSILYDKVSRSKAQQQVALEVLSYHTNARQFEADKLKLSPIPSAACLHLNDLKFDDFSLTDDQMLAASIRMFIDCGFVTKHQMEYETLCKWILTVRKNYRRVIYHNWRHAFNVAQSMFACMKTGRLSSMLSGNECLGLMVGSLCHDLDHRGTNNEFQMKSDSALSLLYGTSTMEHHHFNHAVMILNSEGNDIFKHLSSEAYVSVMKYMKQAILATDLAQYFANRTKFFSLIENKEIDFKTSSHRLLLRNMLMTACDLNGITKPWGIQKKVVHLVTSEFFHQGDLERDTLHVEPGAMMDRNNILDLPKMQVEFFRSTGVPVYEALSKISDKLVPLRQGSTDNLKRWEELSEEVDRGHVNPELEPVLTPLTPVDTCPYE